MHLALWTQRTVNWTTDVFIGLTHVAHAVYCMEKVSATSMSARQQSDPSIAEKLLSFTKLNKNVHLIKRSRLEWWNLDIQNERVLLPAICARICFSFFRLSSTFVTKLLWYTFCNMVLMSLVLSLFTVVHCCLTVNLGVNSRHQK